MDDIRTIAQCVEGRSHKASGKGCQDDSACEKILGRRGCAYIVAVADGHGDPTCRRSARGSVIASDVALEQLGAFARRGLALSRAQFDEMLDDLLDPQDGRGVRRQVTDDIVAAWEGRVVADYDADPLEDIHEQLSALPDEQQLKIKRKLYGTTLVAALWLPGACLLLQEGDGNCMAIHADGNLDISLIPEDPLCVGNVTTSLSDTQAADEFRTAVVDLSVDPLAAVFVGTDGIDKSFAGDDGTNDFYVSVARDVAALGSRSWRQEDFEADLSDSLDRLSELGSGDDASLAAILDVHALRELDDRLEAGQQIFGLRNEHDACVGKLNSMQRRYEYYLTVSPTDPAEADRREAYLQDYERLSRRVDELAALIEGDGEGGLEPEPGEVNPSEVVVSEPAEVAPDGDALNDAAEAAPNGDAVPLAAEPVDLVAPVDDFVASDAALTGPDDGLAHATVPEQGEDDGLPLARPAHEPHVPLATSPGTAQVTELDSTASLRRVGNVRVRGESGARGRRLIVVGLVAVILALLVVGVLLAMRLMGTGAQPAEDPMPAASVETAPVEPLPAEPAVSEPTDAQEVAANGVVGLSAGDRSQIKSIVSQVFSQDQVQDALFSDGVLQNLIKSGKVGAGTARDLANACVEGVKINVTSMTPEDGVSFARVGLTCDARSVSKNDIDALRGQSASCDAFLAACAKAYQGGSSHIIYLPDCLFQKTGEEVGASGWTLPEEGGGRDEVLQSIKDGMEFTYALQQASAFDGEQAVGEPGEQDLWNT